MIRILLVVAGVGLIGLALLHAVFPRRLGWVQDMRDVANLTRQVFYVHIFFIAFTLALMAAVSLAAAWAWPPSGLVAKVLFWGLACFWGARFAFQLFVYDSEHWRGDRFRTAMHVLFTIVWACLTGVYGATASRVA